MVVVITRYLLGYLRRLSIALQDVNCDLAKAHYRCGKLVETLNEVLEEDEAFNALFGKATDTGQIFQRDNRKTQICSKKHVNPFLNDRFQRK